jgi:hypothetical protein
MDIPVRMPQNRTARAETESPIGLIRLGQSTLMTVVKDKERVVSAHALRRIKLLVGSEVTGRS